MAQAWYLKSFREDHLAIEEVVGQSQARILHCLVGEYCKQAITSTTQEGYPACNWRNGDITSTIALLAFSTDDLKEATLTGPHSLNVIPSFTRFRAKKRDEGHFAKGLPGRNILKGLKKPNHHQSPNSLATVDKPLLHESKHTLDVLTLPVRVEVLNHEVDELSQVDIVSR